MGSVKNLVIEKKPDENTFGEGFFEFTDDYSVFDYGKMPDEIPGKGESLCRISAHNFMGLEKEGVESHFIEMASPVRLKIRLVRVINPAEKSLSGEKGNYLIPLEVVFRNSLPAGSSVFSRLEEGLTTLQGLGLSSSPKPGETLSPPIIEVSTKLEPTDRYLSWGEAQEMAALKDDELDKLRQTALKVNSFLSGKADSIGLFQADGKIELAFSPERKMIVVDVFGTMDENRFLSDGVHVSKQILRDYYKTTPWHKELKQAISEGSEKPDWPSPPNAPKELISLVSELYKSFAVSWTGEKTWDVRPLKEMVEEFRKVRKGFGVKK